MPQIDAVPRRPVAEPLRSSALRRSAGRSARCWTAAHGASGLARRAAAHLECPPGRRRTAAAAPCTPARAPGRGAFSPSQWYSAAPPSPARSRSAASARAAPKPAPRLRARRGRRAARDTSPRRSLPPRSQPQGVRWRGRRGPRRRACARSRRRAHAPHPPPPDSWTSCTRQFTPPPLPPPPRPLAPRTPAADPPPSPPPPTPPSPAPPPSPPPRSPVRSVEKNAIRSDELEGVPLDRVVARRDDDPAARLVVLHGELHGGRRHETHVDHVAARGGEPGHRRPGERGAGRARIAPDHDGGAAAAPLAVPCSDDPGAERLCPAAHDVVGQVLADDPAYAGYTHHQSVGHGRNVETRGRRVNRTRVNGVGLRATGRAGATAGRPAR